MVLSCHLSVYIMKKFLAGLVALVVVVSGFGADSTAKAAGIPGENIGTYAEGDAGTGTEAEEIVLPGHSTAEGEELKAQYEAWKNDIIASAMAEETDKYYMGMWLSSFYATSVTCTEVIADEIPGVNEYTEEEVLNTYKTGKGTNIEKYHVLMDIYKDAGYEDMFIGHCSRFGRDDGDYLMLGVWNTRTSHGQRTYTATTFKKNGTCYISISVRVNRD